MHADHFIRRRFSAVTGEYVAAACLLLAANTLAQPNLKAVLRPGQGVLGHPGVTILGISGESASLGPEGQVISEVTLTGTGVGPTNDVAVVVARFGELPILVVREGDELQGGGLPTGVTFSRPNAGDSISRLLISSSDAVAFKAIVNGLTPGASVLLAGPATNVSVVAFVNQAVSGDFGVDYVVTFFSAPRLNNDGLLAFQTKTRNPTNGSLLADIIWTKLLPDLPAPNLSVALRSGVHYDGLPAPDASFGGFTLDGFLLNDEGMMLIHGSQRKPTATAFTTTNGFWLKVGDAVHPVVHADTPLSGLPGVTNATPNSHPVTMSLANGGALSFQSTLYGTGVVSSNNNAIHVGKFSGNSVAVELIARMGYPAPDEAGEPNLPPFDSFSILAPVGVAPSGINVLKTRIASGNPTNDVGIWLWNGTNLTPLAREGDPIPALPGNRWASLPQVCVSPGGQIGVWANIQGTASGTVVAVFDERGRFLGAVRPNDLVELGDGTTRSVSSVQGLSNTGRVLNGSDGLGTQFNARGQLLVRISSPSTIMALYQAPGGTISGQVRRDLDADGDFNAAGDPGYANVTLELFADDATGNPSGVAIETVSPVADGTYSFVNVPDGAYLVKAIVDASEINNNGIAIRTPTDGHRPVIVSGAQPESNVDFLVARVVTISGRVLDDADGNERISAYDTGLPGVKVELFSDPDGNGVLNELISPGGTVFTDPNGHYTFAVFDTSGGRYVVSRTTPSGYTPLINSAGNVTFIAVSLSSNSRSSGNDFLSRLTGRPRITLHRLVPAAVANLNGQSPDQPLEPTSNAADLAGLPEVARGLVADNMTPLIIRFHANPQYAGTPLTLYVDSRKGTVTGIEQSLAVLRNGRWEPFANASSAFPSLASDVFVQLLPLRPSQLTFQNSPSHVTMIQTFKLENPADGSIVSSRDVEFAWIPVALINDFGSDGWSADSVSRARLGRPDEFVRVFDFGSGFSRHAFESLLSEWAFTQFACAAHGRAANEVAELVDSRKYKWHEDAEFMNRGWCRAFLSLGAPFSGSLLIPYLQGVSESGNQEAHRAARRWYFDVVQGGRFSLLDAHQSSVALDPADSYFQRKSIPLAVVWARSVFTKITPEQAPLLRALGISSTDTFSFATPPTWDGVLEANSAALDRVSGDVNFGSFAFQPLGAMNVCHADPRQYFGSLSTQTSDLAVMDSIMLTLNEDSYDHRFSWEAGGPIGAARIEAFRAAGRERFAANAALVNLVTPAPRPGAVSAADAGDASFLFEIALPPSAPMTGAIEWLAMAFGGGPTRTAGITVTPTNTNPPRVTVTVEDFVLGDVVLIGSYETTNGQRVIVEPRLVVSRVPEGVTMTNITIRPLTSEVGIGDRINLEVYGKYSNGSYLRRWVRSTDLTLTNSNPSALDVSDAFAWRAVAPGTALVTVTHAGFSNVATVVVKDLFPKRTYAEWKQANFSAAELADPTISGDAADHDGDGLTTFFEYVTAGDAHEVDFGHHLRLELRDLPGGRTPVLVARLASTLNGHQAALQQSENLTQWTPYYTLNGKPSLNDPAIADYSDFGTAYEILFELPTTPAVTGRYFRLAVQAMP